MAYTKNNFDNTPLPEPRYVEDAFEESEEQQMSDWVDPEEFEEEDVVAENETKTEEKELEQTEAAGQAGGVNEGSTHPVPGHEATKESGSRPIKLAPFKPPKKNNLTPRAAMQTSKTGQKAPWPLEVSSSEISTHESDGSFEEDFPQVNLASKLVQNQAQPETSPSESGVDLPAFLEGRGKTRSKMPPRRHDVVSSVLHSKRNSVNPEHKQSPFRGESDEAPSPKRDADRDHRHRPNSEPIKLTDLIEKNRSLPEFSLILGVAGDDKPLVMDLMDPTPGCVLILGDNVDSNGFHLESILRSACLLNPARQLKIDLITPQPVAYAQLTDMPQLNSALHPAQADTFGLLSALFEIVEDRQRGKKKRPIHILAIDQIDALTSGLASESLSFLRWVLRRGPDANVWIIATLSTQKVSAMDWKTLNAFGLRLLGRIVDVNATVNLTDIPQKQLGRLISGKEACLMLDEDVIQFKIPEF